jgi:hypothetical protein
VVLLIATKEEERQVLEKIKKMVAELGENSYLAAAFTGSFEMAEQNIDNDAAYTAQYYIDRVVKAADTEKRIDDELTTTKAMLAAVQEAHQATTENFDATQEQAYKYAHEIDNMKATMNAKETEIISLKAKLYDYMTKEISLAEQPILAERDG